MSDKHSPKYLKEIYNIVSNKLKLLNKPKSDLIAIQQKYHDEVLEVVKEYIDIYVLTKKPDFL